MPATDFNNVPDDARVWVYASSRELTGAEQASLLARVDDFLSRWNAHGHPVVGARDLRHDRFLILAADERATGVSGCSIDSLYVALREVQSEFGTTLLDSTTVWFRDRDGTVRGLPRPEFRELASSGGVDAETVVFDNTVATAGDVRHGRWETPARNAWHARAFALATAAQAG